MRGGRTRGARKRGGRPAAGDAAAAAGAWAELLRVSALFTVPGDALAGAAVSGLRLNRGTALAAASSVCLYEAGMVLNDWADRHIDAVERPGRPLPSGRVRPSSALAASAVLTAAGLGLAAAAGRRALLTATALAGTVWAYDLCLKHTALGPAAMAAARGLDLVLGAEATAESAVAAASAASAVPRPGHLRPAPQGSRAAPGAARVGPGPTAPAVTGVVPPSPPSVPRRVLDGTLRGASRTTRRAAAVAARGTTPPVRAGDVVRAAGLVGAHITEPAVSGGGPPPASPVRALLPGGLPDVASTSSVRRRVLGRALRDVGRWAGGVTHAGPRSGEVLRAAGLVGAHILAVTTVSRRETLGASPAVPLVALGAVGVVASAVGGAFANGGPPRTDQARTAHTRTPQVGTGDGRFGHVSADAPAAAWLRAAPAVAYAAAGGRPLAHAVFNPSPALLQRAVGGGIRATIPLQAALAARAGRPGTAAAVLALLPAASRLSRKVSPT